MAALILADAHGQPPMQGKTSQMEAQRRKQQSCVALHVATGEVRWGGGGHRHTAAVIGGSLRAGIETIPGTSTACQPPLWPSAPDGVDHRLHSEQEPRGCR